MATRAMVFQRARLRPFAGATPQAFDKDLNREGEAPWRQRMVSHVCGRARAARPS